MKESKLVEGYKNRVQSFIYKMISDPYKINYNDEFQKKFSFRPEQSFKKNFKLKPFETDKSRVEKYLQNHKEDHRKYELEKCKKIDIENLDQEQQINYLQPIMKFKARTDLERIFDTVNSNYYGKVDSSIIHNQLRSLGLISVKNNHIGNMDEYSLLKEKLKVTPQTLTYLIKEKQRLEKGPKNPEIGNLIKNISNIIHINKQILRKGLPVWGWGGGQKNKSKSFNKRKNLNNSLAKNILSEYQKKTHFKAIVSCTLDLDTYSTNNDNSDNEDCNYTKYKKSCFSNDDKYKYKMLKTFSNTKSVKDIKEYSNINNKIKLINETNPNNLKKKNDYNKICLKTFHKNKLYSHEKMEYLKGLFTKNDNNKSPELNIHRLAYEDEEETRKKIERLNNVVINGKNYNKFDIAKISNAVLQQCNYIKKYHDKEIAGDGKTMITRGMSVNEFTKKYNLPK